MKTGYFKVVGGCGRGQYFLVSSQSCQVGLCIVYIFNKFSFKIHKTAILSLFYHFWISICYEYATILAENDGL